MGRKTVYEVPGVGETIGDNLTAAGIKSAKRLYGVYLTDPDSFEDYVMSYGANSGQQKAAYRAMRDYANNHE